MMCFRRLISMLLIVCVFFSAMTVVIAADENKQGILEIYPEVSGLFEKYGLINEETDLSATVTRGGFAVLLAKLELGGNIPDTAPRFTDILDEEVDAAVSCLADMGVVGGYPDGKFYPDREITFGQALLMILRLMDVTYGLENEHTVQAAAQQFGLTDGLKLTSDTTIDYSQSYALLYNMLFAEIPHEAYDIIGTVNDLAPYYNRRLGLCYIEGIVTDDGRTTLTGESTSHTGKIKIDNISVAYNSETAELLGKSVICWYKENTADVYEAVCLSEAKKNNVIVIPSQRLYGFKNNTYEYSLDEFEDGTYNTSLEAECTVVYNGKTVSSGNAANFNVNMLTPQYGRVILLDNDGDRRAEVVRVEDYKYFVVSSVDLHNEKLYFKQAAAVGETPHETQLDLKSCDYIIRKNGSTVTIDKIKAGNILAVMKDLDNDYVIEASDKTVSGNIEKLDTKKNKAIIDGGAFIYSKNAALSVGETGVFYLAFDGIIVYFEAQNTDMMLGYLYGKGEPEMFSAPIKVRIFDQNGTHTTYDLDEKVYIDGVRYTDGQKMYDALDADPQNNASFAGIIMYQLNNGKIKKIDLPDAPSENAKEGFRIVQQATDSSSSYLAKYGIGGWKFVLTDQTVCFKVTDNISDMEKLAKVYKGPASSSAQVKDWKAYYTAGDKLGADVFLYKIAGGEAVDANERIQLIISTELVYRDDEIMYKITYIGQNGVEFTKVAEKETVEQVKTVNGADVTLIPGPGDLVRTAAVEDTITLMEYVYSYDSGYLDTAYSLFPSNSDAAYYDLRQRVGFGWIEKTDNNAFHLKQTLPTVTSGGTPIDYVFTNNFTVFVVRDERNGRTVTKGSIADMKPRTVVASSPSFVFYSSRFEYPDYIVIYDDVDDPTDVPAAVRMR